MSSRARRWRAIALGAAAALVAGLASLIHLNVPLPIPRMPEKSPPPPPQLSATDFDQLSYDFISPSTGWAVDLRNYPDSEVGTFWIVHTTDGAHRWENQYSGSFATGATSHVVFFDRMHGFVVIEAAGPVEEASSSELSVGIAMRGQNEGWDGTLGDEPEVLLSADGGRSWEPRYLPGGGSLPSVCSSSVMLVPGDGVIARASCKDGSSGQAASFDAGQTWTPLVAPPPDESSWDRITFIDSRHWWAMTGGALWKTADGGQTWTDYGLPVDDWGEYLPHALDSSHAWAELQHTGPNESRLTGLAMTADGGIHWTQVNAPRP